MHNNELVSLWRQPQTTQPPFRWIRLPVGSIFLNVGNEVGTPYQLAKTNNKCPLVPC